MWNWLAQNGATVVICLLLAVLAVWIIRREVKNRKKGGCSCGCGGCPMGDKCPSNPQSREHRNP